MIVDDYDRALAACAMVAFVREFACPGTDVKGRKVMRALFCGSCYATEEKHGKKIRDAIEALSPGDVVVHCGVEGVDRIAGELARQYGLTVEVRPQAWEALFYRKEFINARVDVVHAFPHDGRSCTAEMVKAARTAGVSVVEHPLGEVEGVPV